MRPDDHRLAAELLAVVAANHLGQPARLCQAIHHTRHADTGDRPLDLDNDRLVGGVIDHRQALDDTPLGGAVRSEEHTSELQSLMRISYAVFCLKKTNKNKS